jgi:hypothetical protein
MRATPGPAAVAVRLIALNWWRNAIICPRRPKVAANGKRRVNLDRNRHPFSGIEAESARPVPGSPAGGATVVMRKPPTPAAYSSP